VHGEVDALSRARRGVVVAVTAEYRDLALAQQLEHRGVQPGAARRSVPGAELIAPAPVPDPDEEQVARADTDVLGLFGAGHVLDSDVIARLQPLHAAQPRDVEQHAPSGDALASQVDGQVAGIRRDAVVQHAVVADVTQRVQVAVGIAVHVQEQGVHGEIESVAAAWPGGGMGEVVHPGLRVIRGRLALDRGRE